MAFRHITTGATVLFESRNGSYVFVIGQEAANLPFITKIERQNRLMGKFTEYGFDKNYFDANFEALA